MNINPRQAATLRGQTGRMCNCDTGIECEATGTCDLGPTITRVLDWNRVERCSMIFCDRTYHLSQPRASCNTSGEKHFASSRLDKTPLHCFTEHREGCLLE